MRSECVGILTAGCLLLNGCGLPPAGLMKAAFEPAVATEQIDPSFAAGFGVLGGFEDARMVSSWEIHDSVLMGVKVTREEGQDVWFVRLSTLAPETFAAGAEDESAPLKEFAVPFGLGGVKTGTKFVAPPSRLLIEMYDDTGTLLRSSIRTVPQVSTNANLLDVLAGRPVTPGAAESMDGVAGMMTMLQLMGGARSLAPIRDSIRDHVVRRPSVIALLLAGLRLQVDAMIDANAIALTQHATHLSSAPRYESRFPLLLSGQRLFDCRVVVGQPQAPYSLTGGALLVEVAHPEKSSNRLTVCVLAAKSTGRAGAKTLATR